MTQTKPNQSRKKSFCAINFKVNTFPQSRAKDITSILFDLRRAAKRNNGNGEVRNNNTYTKNKGNKTLAGRETELEEDKAENRTHKIHILLRCCHHYIKSWQSHKARQLELALGWGWTELRQRLSLGRHRALTAEATCQLKLMHSSQEVQCTGRGSGDWPYDYLYCYTLQNEMK